MTGDLFRTPDTAVFSPDGRHRYELTRELGGTRPLVVCGLNPSTATAIKDDRTIAREVDFAHRWRCGRLVKVNAYGYRTKSPREMFAAKRAGVDIVGRGMLGMVGAIHVAHEIEPDIEAEPFDVGNDFYIATNAKLAVDLDGIFVVAWGTWIELERELEIVAILNLVGAMPMCIKANQDGTPIHPLYQPADSQLVRWEPRAAE